MNWYIQCSVGFVGDATLGVTVPDMAHAQIWISQALALTAMATLNIAFPGITGTMVVQGSPDWQGC